jgi:hypothetical protein
MKKILKVMIFAIALMGLTACEESAQTTPQAPTPRDAIQVFLAGKHQLRQMGSQRETHGNLSGGYFLFAGGISGGTDTQVVVKFAWLTPEGYYAISSLPLEKFRIKIDETATSPIIEFGQNEHCWEYLPHVQNIFDSCVPYAMVTAKSADWPMSIELPLSETPIKK